MTEALEYGYIATSTGGALAMKSRIVKIGNSQGIRIPEPLLEQTGLGEEVEIQVEGKRLIMGPPARLRAGWDAVFRRMASVGDHVLVDGDARIPTSWEEAEWEW